jgi:hypothetical protein
VTFLLETTARTLTTVMRHAAAGRIPDWALRTLAGAAAAALVVAVVWPHPAAQTTLLVVWAAFAVVVYPGLVGAAVRWWVARRDGGPCRICTPQRRCLDCLPYL